MVEVTQWLSRYTDSLLAAGNFTVAVFMLVLACISAYLLTHSEFRKNSFLPPILAGVCLMEFSWFIHRMYYGTWRLLKEWGFVGWDRWLIDNSYFALIPVAGILTGAGMVLTPIIAWFRLSDQPSKKDLLVAFSFMFGVYWFLWFSIYNGNDPEVRSTIVRPPITCSDFFVPKPLISIPVRNPYRFSN